MPGMDGTGPLGMGPLTGRRMGRCQGAVPPYGFGRGLGRGRGMWCWRGFGWMEAPPLTADEERAMLEAELKRLEAATESVKKRISELKGKK